MMNDFYENMGKYIKLFCKHKYGTLTKAAKRMDVTVQYLSHIINGKRTLPDRIIKKLIAEGFDENIYIEFTDKEDENPDLLTKKELIRVISEKNKTIRQQAEVIDILNERLNKLV